MKTNNKAEARRLRKLAFNKDIELRKIAEDLGYHPAYVSNVLRWQDESLTALERIKVYLEEAPEPQADSCTDVPIDHP